MVKAAFFDIDGTLVDTNGFHVLACDEAKITMIDRAAWERLSRFESHDYVAKWYVGKHARTLNAARTKEVTSNFAQGREYFASAADADISVRPVLLYYGALSLSRGVILLRNSYKNESNLKSSHGLETVTWQQTLPKAWSTSWIWHSGPRMAPSANSSKRREIRKQPPGGPRLHLR
jgi:hypothetical protein